ncbi:HAD hydrolase-like protein [Phaeovulum vinaykumarii]|uniref:phosphoglycolate phosphatase n=1 Tax=Phaeovulum vinaykumarii TaxID=407234 RepID=A0A1N7LLM5_9RHOB|nr:HAD hydrolase-like protein [Phaeovulum vinaykumarii]SIS74707.1 phosphoglycolate phosphatase [Phaeovulum vinaykumarii]SOC05209.1 phosphoglycolate phosphatase [Phaeovulum vinaykumarii]
MRTIIYDLDGTLADTSGDLLAAANACLAARGLAVRLDEGDTLVAFHGGRAMLRTAFARAGLSEAEAAPLIEQDYPRLLEHYGANIDRHSRLYPGAEAALQAMAAAGWVQAVCTNKPEGLARVLLDKLGVAHHFRALIGADTLAVRKPDPLAYTECVARAGGELGRSFLLGDTETDRRTAQAAGVPCALVAFGPEGAGIARLAPEAMLDHYDGLAELAETLVPDTRP